MDENTVETDRRTFLAEERTLLAAERTYAAWMRTGLTSLAAGVGAKALLQGLVSDWLAMATAIVLVVFAQFCFAAGVWREWIDGSAIKGAQLRRLPPWLLIMFNGFLIVLALVVVIDLLQG